MAECGASGLLQRDKLKVV